MDSLLSRRLLVAAALGVLSAVLWMRLGLYGFGLPAGGLALLPLAIAVAFYLLRREPLETGVVVTTFALAWAIFEAFTWINASLDPGVSIPDWSPTPLAVAVALIIVGVVATFTASRAEH